MIKTRAGTRLRTTLNGRTGINAKVGNKLRNKAMHGEANKTERPLAMKTEEGRDIERTSVGNLFNFHDVVLMELPPERT